MKSYLSKSLVNSFLVLSMLLLTGCGGEILFSALPEKEANRVVALLQRSGIPSQKGTGSKGLYQITVDPQYFSNEDNLLDWYNYPENVTSPLDIILNNKGLVSSPTMERMRYIAVKSKMVSNALEKVNGIEYATVVLVSELDVPSDNDSLKHNSASVFIKYRPQFPINDHLLDIKLLVLNSFSELNLEDISLVAFPTYQWEETSFLEVIGTDKNLAIKSTPASTYTIVILVILLILLILAVLGLTLFKQQIQHISFLNKLTGGTDDDGTPTTSR